MTPSELICLSGIALPPAIVPSRYIQGRGAKLRTWRDKFTALIIKLGHCEIQIRPQGVKTSQRPLPGTGPFSHVGSQKGPLGVSKGTSPAIFGATVSSAGGFQPGWLWSLWA